MSLITVTIDGESTAPIIWVRMTPWTPSAIQTHIEIPGGSELGVTFPKGTDNATTTLQGRVPWNAEGEAMYLRLPNARLTVDNGISVREGIAGTPVAQDGNLGWIYFSLSVRGV